MKIETISGEFLDSILFKQYFNTLVNRYFKILPMKENNESSTLTYIQSLRDELIGFGGLVPNSKESSLYITLLSILQFFVDNPDCPIYVVKREVFRAISICNKLEGIYDDREV